MSGGRIGGAQGGTVVNSMCSGSRLADVGPCPTTHYVTLGKLGHSYAPGFSICKMGVSTEFSFWGCCEDERS